MGKEKAGFLTPKAIANRIKAKGLQKLRWYCQMCQKQCRDENGFKCHMMSESHQRQLLLFAENPDKYIDTFSKDFEDEYLELLRRRFGTKRVNANIVYQEYITNRDHIHMNSTQWETLTDFVKFLGREGKCVVDYTEKGWFVQYVDRDPETIQRMETIKAKERMDMDDEEKMSRFIAKQIERAAETDRSVQEAEFTELIRENDDQKVTFSLAGLSKKKDDESERKTKDNPLASVSPKDIFKKPKSEATTCRPGRKAEKRKSTLGEIIEFEEKLKEKQNRRDYWLHKGIVVKIISKKLGDSFYKKKGYVKEVQDLYTAIIKMIDTGEKLRVDQTHVETVVPAIGKTVLIVNGAYRGETATLEQIFAEKFCCTIKINSGLLSGRVLEGVQYEDICRVYQQDS